MNSIIEDERNAHSEIEQYENFMVDLFLQNAKSVSVYSYIHCVYIYPLYIA